MIGSGKVWRASAPLSAAMALALAFAADSAVAQVRSNAQAEDSRAVRARGGAAPIVPPAVGRYVAESGEGFILDRSGRHPLLRFDRREETWVLRPSPAPRGDVIYRNDAGAQVLRVTPGGGMTVYTSRAPSGSPASFSSSGSSLTPPTLGPAQLFSLMTRRSAMVSQAVGRLVEVNVDTGPTSEALTVEALIVATDALIRIARSPSTAGVLSRLRSLTIVEGTRPGVIYSNGRLRISVAPALGVAGRPSSARVIAAVTEG